MQFVASQEIYNENETDSQLYYIWKKAIKKTIVSRAPLSGVGEDWVEIVIPHQVTVIVIIFIIVVIIVVLAVIVMIINILSRWV